MSIRLVLMKATLQLLMNICLFLNHAMSTIKDIIAQEELFPAFEEQVLPCYEKLANYIQNQHQVKQSSLLVAVNGAQGTGKSTMALFLKAFLKEKGKRVAVISIDDLYLTYKERQSLAEHVHSLLLTRGVPGTHDITLGQCVIDNLINASTEHVVEIPAFDKAKDDRKSESNWHSEQGPIDIIILEGWCVGATALPENDLDIPINQLEANEDTNATWRHYMNQQLNNQYRDFFNQFDLLVMLKAPSFDCVREWRALQEEKLARKMQVQINENNTDKDGENNAPFKGLMDSNALNRFMMHYERLTKHMLEEMPNRSNVLIALNPDHSIQSVDYKT